MNELYQIGIPVERLSTVFMLWDSFEKPCKMIINPAKTDGFAVVEFRHMLLASEIIKAIPNSKVKIEQQAVKTIQI